MPDVGTLIKIAADQGPGFGLGLAVGFGVFLTCLLRGFVVPRPFYRREEKRADRAEARLDRAGRIAAAATRRPPRE